MHSDFHTNPARPRVIVIGGGFAGLWAVRGLAAAPVDILLIDRNNHHTFQPLLYQVATAGLASPSIAAPLRHILRNQRNVTVLQGTVDGIDTHAREVRMGNERHAYDFLVVASGVSHAYFGHDDWARFAPGLKTLDDALKIRARILSAFEAAERCTHADDVAAQLTFVVVGAGPTGVELAGTLAEIARHTLKREFRRIDPTSARVILVEAGARVLPAFPDALSASAEQQLQKLGVQVMKGRAITQVDAQGVKIGDESLPARTVLWAAGVTASPLGRMLGVAVDRNGRVPVSPELTIADHADVFVAGDLAAFTQDDGPVPGIAPAAKQMGRHVARTIAARVANLPPPPPFRYKHAGLLATIGRMAAVADLGKVRLTGPLAWWFWLLAHVYFLIGFRNRLVVLIDWAQAYWTYQRGARIIVRDFQP